MDAGDAMAVLETRRKSVEEQLRDQLAYVAYVRTQVSYGEKRRQELEGEIGAIDRALDALRREPNGLEEKLAEVVSLHVEAVHG